MEFGGFVCDWFKMKWWVGGFGTSVAKKLAVTVILMKNIFLLLTQILYAYQFAISGRSHYDYLIINKTTIV